MESLPGRRNASLGKHSVTTLASRGSSAWHRKREFIVTTSGGTASGRTTAASESLRRSARVACSERKAVQSGHVTIKVSMPIPLSCGATAWVACNKRIVTERDPTLDLLAADQ